ncbi:methylated-DNA--[protein]-cysteine S-methyltransferase [Roseococcus sp. SYP-B2431]|uniref:methylated-DNA--[protein]-cysteine S-methyltransferase n=1 Tax=Roseococcus sp. SYP-B2431 TaxID=2496640 RepID=UPI00103B81B5|nr:methylated-DNA--[protein]-cysteine S-methyltransferase [Roseococcus sp. SYP-B2431]TCH98707.1 methylated-DNA--[protein]-cysteine S-methyltransferase [Roseococcus sp. SYP-B2431]
MTRLLVDRLETPIGEALLVTDGEGRLRGLDWADHEARLSRLLRLNHRPFAPEAGAAPEAMRRALTAYFEGDLGSLAVISWRATGTPFQQALWAALTTIPAGQTLSYGALAAKLGSPRAVRAVGAANGANPISLVLPCHRVIGSDGALTGYGGGLDRKRWLLRHEGAAFRETRAA